MSRNEINQLKKLAGMLNEGWFDKPESKPQADEYDAWKQVETALSNITTAVRDFQNHAANLPSSEEQDEAYAHLVGLLGEYLSKAERGDII